MMVNDGTSVDLANDSVHFDGLYGYINKTGQIVIPCEYEEASPAFDEDGTCGCESPAVGERSTRWEV